uniref:Late embryogenesis abundant protein n=1 Tax=Quercus lobata TaxID=97700 RepID=A0A7N2MP19_QUELO
MVAEAGPPKQKKVKCKDKKYPTCYHVDKYCPTTCPRTCVVDCVSCQPVCTSSPSPPPPPPPPKPRKQSPPPPPRTYPSPSPPPPTPTIYSSPPPPPPSTIHSSPPPTTIYPSPSPPPLTTPTPPSSHPPPPPPASSSDGKKVRCMNKNYPQCYAMEHSCPSGCPEQCEVDCVTCSPVCNCNRPGAVCQDPRFVGGDGITFYFHGILFDTHNLFIGAKNTSIWDDSNDRLSLGFNGEPIHLLDGEGTKWESTTSPSVTITRLRDTNSVEVEVEGNFKIKATVVPITEKDSRVHNYGITQEDCFAHLDLSFKFYALSGRVNGVLGQTYASNYVSKVKMGVVMPVLGGDKEFSSSSLFATDCAVARFTGQFTEGNSLENLEFGNLNCSSGMNGRGVVCKR